MEDRISLPPDGPPISSNPDISGDQETMIARTLICNYENFLLALKCFNNIHNASLEEKKAYVNENRGTFPELLMIEMGPFKEFPHAYDPYWLECLQAVGSTTIQGVKKTTAIQPLE